MNNRNNARTENDNSNPWGWKVKRPRPNVEALEAKRVMTNPLSRACKMAYLKCADIDVNQEQNAALISGRPSRIPQ